MVVPATRLGLDMEFLEGVSSSAEALDRGTPGSCAQEGMPRPGDVLPSSPAPRSVSARGRILLGCTHLHSRVEAWAGSNGAMGGGPCPWRSGRRVNVIEGRGSGGPCSAREWEPLPLLPYLCVVLGNLSSGALVTLLLVSYPWDLKVRPTGGQWEGSRDRWRELQTRLLGSCAQWEPCVGEKVPLLSPKRKHTGTGVDIGNMGLEILVKSWQRASLPCPLRSWRSW